MELSTVYLCNAHDSVMVIPVTLICSVVAMFPNTQVDPSGHISLTGKFSLMCHPYLEVVQFTKDDIQR